MRRLKTPLLVLLGVVLLPALLLAATLGNATQPTATTVNCEDSADLVKATASAGSGTLASITIWMNVTVTSKDAQAAIYTYVSDTEAGALIENSTSTTVGTGANQQITFSGFTAAITNGTSYFVGVFCEADTGVAEIYADNTSTGASIAQSGITFPSWPADFVDTSTTTRRYGAYGTYSVAGGKSLLTLGVGR